MPKSNRERGFKLFRKRGEPLSRLTELLADGPEHGADARGFGRGDLEQALEASGLTEVAEQLVDGFLGRQLARRPPVAEEVEKGGVGLGKCPPRLRPPGVDDRILADDEPRQAQAVGRQFDPGGVLGGEAQEVGRRDARRENALSAERAGSGSGPCWAGSARRPSAGAGNTGPCPAAGSCPGGPGGTAFAPRP